MLEKNNDNSNTPPRHLQMVKDDELLFHEAKRVIRSTTLITDRNPPETDQALVYCYKCDTPRTHIFSGRRPIKSLAGETLYVELVYKCCSCHDERVWGTEEETTDDITK